MLLCVERGLEFKLIMYGDTVMKTTGASAVIDGQNTYCRGPAHREGWVAGNGVTNKKTSCGLAIVDLGDR